MDDVHEKRKVDQSFNDHHSSFEKRQVTDDLRAVSVLNRSEEEIFQSAVPTTISMACPAEKVSIIIGRKGIIVQDIMRRSGCRIFVEQNYPEGHPRQIQITGHPRDMGIAIALVTLVIEHGPGIISAAPAQTQSAPHYHETIEGDFLCPVGKAGQVIGAKGSNVQEIFNRTGCRVQVMQEISEHGDRRVIFHGTPSQVREAKVLVNHLINVGSFDESSVATGDITSTHGTKNGTPSPQLRTVEADIDPEKVRLVIGAKGVTIGEIMKRSGCKIHINQNFPDSSTCHKIVYTGTPQQIDIAKYLVESVVVHGMSALYAVLNGSESIVIQEVNIFPNQSKSALSPDLISELQSRYGVRINFDFADGSYADCVVRVSVIGKVDNVESAVKVLHQMIDIRESEGKYSSKNVESYVSPSTVNSSPIFALGKDGLSGHLESAFALQDGSQQQVAEIKNEVMGRIIGAKSATISLIKLKSGASIQVLKSDNVKGTTRVVLTGAPQAVQLAAQMVQEVLVNGTGKLLKMPDAMDGGSQFSPKYSGANDHYHGGNAGPSQQYHASDYDTCSAVGSKASSSRRN